jgi:DNA-binding response OmpR family regulator
VADVLLPTTPRVLVVDDDEHMGRLLAAVARQTGAEVARAASGREALDAAPDADIVLLDYHLPDMSGLDVLGALRARALPPAVIMVTAHGNETIAAAALRRGADDYLVKDPSLRELLPQVLERVRRTRALRSALATAERELVRTERLAAIGEMTITLHHEINNPLMAAFAELELLHGDAATTAAQREGIDRVRDALERIRDIIRRLRELKHSRTTNYLEGVRMLDLSRPGAPAGGAAAPAGTIRGSAVMYVPEEDLARVTLLLLRRAGFRVQRVDSVADLRRWAAAVGVHLVVVAGESGRAGADPLHGFRPEEGRCYTLVALVAGDGSGARTAGADHVVALPFDPATFGAELVGAMAR